MASFCNTQADAGTGVIDLTAPICLLATCTTDDGGDTGGLIDVDAPICVLSDCRNPSGDDPGTGGGGGTDPTDDPGTTGEDTPPGGNEDDPDDGGNGGGSGAGGTDGGDANGDGILSATDNDTDVLAALLDNVQASGTLPLTGINLLAILLLGLTLLGLGATLRRRQTTTTH